MTSITRLCAIATIALAAWPANAADDPNAAAAAEKARIEAQTALINAEAARINARAARDKAKIEALGLPQFENKTELADKGGAIETAMLSSRAVAAAAQFVADNLGKDKEGNDRCRQDGPTILVLAANEKFELNYAKTMRARIGYHREILNQAMAKKDAKGGNGLLSLGLPIGLISAAAGLFGNDTKVSGVELPEIGNQVLAIAVAGKLKQCATLPSAGAGIADIDSQPIDPQTIAMFPPSIPSWVTDTMTKRNLAAQKLADIPEKGTPAQKAQAEQLKAAIAAFDKFYVDINTPEEDGKTAFVRAILVDKVTSKKDVMLLRVAIDRAGGTITNSKNIWTFFGGDPVRVSGGLVASYLLVDADDGAINEAGSFACQTAQASLRNVQSGNWYGSEKGVRSTDPTTASCQ